MMISDASARALGEIALRERDLLHAFDPGAVPERSDVARAPASVYSRDALSVTAPPGTYFVTRAANGTVLYTRDGCLQSHRGALLDASGLPVLGYSGGMLRPIHADAVDIALGAASPLRIAPDGAVTYRRTVIDPQSGRSESREVLAGRIALARFTAGTPLQHVDAQHAKATVAPHTGMPADGNFEPIVTHARESSGIDVDRGLQRLQEAYLAFDAVGAAGKAQGSIAKTAMDLLT